MFQIRQVIRKESGWWVGTKWIKSWKNWVGYGELGICYCSLQASLVWRCGGGKVWPVWLPIPLYNSYRSPNASLITVARVKKQLIYAYWIQKEKVCLPPRWVPVLVEPYILPRNTCEGCLEKKVKQMAAVDGHHGFTEPHVAGAEVSVHVMQPVGHGVNGVDDEAHLAVLNIVVLQILITCPHMREQ